MRHVLRMAVICFVLMMLVQCAFSAVLPVSATKYIQPPKGDGSYDFSSELKSGVGATTLYQTLMADDWICSDGRRITDIHWWGSYWTPSGGSCAPYSDWLPGADSPNGVQEFKITVYDNASAPFDQPGAVRWQQTFAGVPETLYGTFTKTPGVTEKVYGYSVYLNDQYPPLTQTAGTKYWLSIQSANNFAGIQWGWHEGVGNYGLNSLQKMSPEGSWYLACSGHDLAFELTTVPEPASVMALGAGLISMGGMFIRRRRS